ncbi:fimbrial protein [Pseudomonas chlororaphis]|uniref:fimbrial protein n=1 Tax=Pseudomonas chlororaphis TaxID=587753 RepID=UPI000AE90C5C|nr:fimbrial protein [Pseudomonas chlororaphis]
MKIVFFILLLFSNVSFAATCTFNEFNISVPPIEIGVRDGRLPQVISSSWHMVSGTGITCTGLQKEATFHTLANNSANTTNQNLNVDGTDYKIYSSGVNGLGVIMEAADIGEEYKPFGPTNPTEVIMWKSNTGAKTYFKAGVKFRVKYVVTERLAAGTISVPSTDLMRFGAYAGIYHGWGKVKNNATTIKVKYPSCTLSMPGTVKLPSIDASRMRSTGDTAGETFFEVGLNCLPGLIDSNIRYTITDVAKPSNRSSTLSLLTTEGAATGVDLQVLDGANLISFGADSSAPDNKNQRDFGLLSKAGGWLSKKLTVRYVRTSNLLIPGNIKAGVTITMSYQ